MTNEEFLQELNERKIAKIAEINEKLGGEIYRCPKCKQTLGSIIFKKPNFCYDCGQALIFDKAEVIQIGPR